MMALRHFLAKRVLEVALESPGNLSPEARGPLHNRVEIRAVIRPFGPRPFIRPFVRERGDLVGSGLSERTATEWMKTGRIGKPDSVCGGAGSVPSCTKDRIR